MNPVVVRLDHTVGSNKRYWQAAGSDLLFSEIEMESGQFLLDRMGEHRSCRFLRNHYVLSDQFYCERMVGGTKYREDENGNPAPDFSRILAVYKEMVKRGIKPIVEYDFMPEPLKKKGEGRGDWDSGPADWDKWRIVMQQFTQALVDTFGVEELRTWRFEVWNEPDGFPLEEREIFYRMYDEFAAVIKAADDQLLIGGPGCWHFEFLEGFLQHVTSGKNHVTGGVGAPIDFVSYHSYATVSGMQSLAPFMRPHADKILSDAWYVRQIMERYQLLHVPFQMNEWGLCAHFAQNVEAYPALHYRNSEYAASFLARLVDGFDHMQDELNFCPEILLFWGFSWEDGENVMFRGNRELTTGYHVVKPIMTAYEMLAKLEAQRVLVEGRNDPLGVLATRSSKRLTMVVYALNESDEQDQTVRTVSLQLQGLPVAEDRLSLHVTRLDAEHHNTFRLWQQMGCPEHPDAEQIRLLHAAGELSVDEEIVCEVTQHQGCFELPITGNSVCLIEADI